MERNDEIVSETELAALAELAGFSIEKHQGRHRLRTWDGNAIGPFKTDRECLVWLSMMCGPRSCS
jgi:hypothetical protein